MGHHLPSGTVGRAVAPVLRRKRRARPLDVTLDEDPHHLHQPATRSRQTPPPPAAAPAGIPAGLRWRRRSADSDRGSRCGRSGRREHYSAAARHSTCRRIPRECSPGRRGRLWSGSRGAGREMAGERKKWRERGFPRGDHAVGRRDVGAGEGGKAREFHRRGIGVVVGVSACQ